MQTVTADHLFRKSNNVRIRTEIDNLCRSVDDSILRAHSNGYSEINYELPFHFMIPNLQLKDAQLIIYSRLIEEYERRGFRVILYSPKEDDENQISILRIQWVNILSESEKERMNKIIKDHIKVIPNKHN